MLRRKKKVAASCPLALLSSACMSIFEALLVQQKSLFRLSIFMVCLGLGFFGYALFELFMGTWLAMLITLIVVAFAFALAFRYHFLYFQMKEKKLGCTLSEWLHQGLLKEKP